MAKSRRRRKKKTQPRVPEVLWRIYGNKARTLLDTLVSLIPNNHSRGVCSCSPSTSCLACCDDHQAFLVRPRDPKAYRVLMSRCFVVVPEAAPMLQAWNPSCCLSQLQLVRRTIEVMLCKEPSSSNVLCNGYDKFTSSSPAVELLTTSAWVMLLERVGDIVMHYLLRHTFIFVPEPQNNHFQVSGTSIGNLNLKTTHGNKRLPDKDPLLLHSVSRAYTKRKRNDYTDSSLVRCHYASESDKKTTSHGVHEKLKMHSQSNPFGENLPASREGFAISDVSSADNLKLHSSGGIMESKKRTRQHCWQRRKKLSQSNLMGAADNNFDARSECHLVATRNFMGV